MIAIIPFFQFKAHLLIADLLPGRQPLQFFFEISMDFFLRNATYLDIPVVHRNVHQVVQIVEHAHLPELRHACQQCEFDTTVHRLQNAVERLQHISQFRLHRFVVQVL